MNLPLLSRRILPELWVQVLLFPPSLSLNQEENVSDASSEPSDSLCDSVWMS